MKRVMILVTAWLFGMLLVNVPTCQAAPDDYMSKVEALIAPAGGKPGAIMGVDDLATLGRLRTGEADGHVISLSMVDVAGESFKKALRMDVSKPASVFWKASVQASATAPVKKGDVIWVIYHLRGGQPGLGGSEAVVSMAVKPGNPPYEPSRGVTGRRVDLNDSWQTVMLAGVAKEDLAAGQLRFDLYPAYQKQWVELAGMMAYNLGPDADITKLPVTSTQTPTTYEGREPDAPWRAEAAARIREHRQAPLTVRVVDAAGAPVQGAQVSVKLAKNAFGFGVALDGWLYMADTEQGKDLPAHRDGRWVMNPTFPPDSADAQRYRTEARRLFNTVVAENDMKAYRLVDGPLPMERSMRHARDFVKRLRADGFNVYGHVLVWPGWGYSPKSWKAMASNPPELRKAVEQYIKDTINNFGPDDLIAWDVVNEPYGNQNLQEVFGVESLADWFRVARAVHPTVKLHINEAARPGTKQVETRSSLHAHLQMLQREGAPVDGVGLQCHYGHPPAIEAIKAELDAYAAYGIDIWVTEYDIYTSATDDAAREAIEADFTRDFLMLCYSHPAVKGFNMWGFWDGLHWKGRAPIFRKDWSLKPSGEQFIDLVHRQWKTIEQGTTDAQGNFSVQGHLGEYVITATVNGKQFSAEPTSLSKPGTEVVIRTK
jgi:endo-1,4-beta-xylanase